MKINWIHRMLFAGLFILGFLLLKNAYIVYADEITGTRVNPYSGQWESVYSELSSSSAELTSDNMVLRQYLIGTQGWSAVEQSRYEFYADFTNADTYEYLYYCNESVKCCNNPDQIAKQRQVITIKNKSYVFSDVVWYGDGNSYLFSDPIDISGENWGREKVVIDLFSPKTTCRNCGAEIIRRTSMPGWIYIKDMRGSAKLTDMNASWGDTVTITPEYNKYVDHVEWAIQYPGEASYTLLSDGQKANGMTVSGAKSKTLTLSNLPAVSGAIKLAVYAYDKNNQLPIGAQYPKTNFTMTLTAKDTTGPNVTITKTQDASSKKILINVEASDPGGLHANPYSFDGGKTYGTASVLGCSKAGKVTVCVKDASGNITVKEVFIDAIEIEKLNPSKPSGQDNNVNVPGTTSSSGSGLSGGSDGTNQGTSSPSNSSNSSGSGSGSNSATNDQYKKPSDSFNEIKNNGNTDSVTNATVGTTAKTDAAGSKGTGTKDASSTSKTSSKNVGEDASSKDPNKVSSVSKEKSDSLFEKILNNSEDYLSSEEVSVSGDGKLSGAGTGEIRLGKLEKGNDEYSDFPESDGEYADDGKSNDVNSAVNARETDNDGIGFIIGVVVLIVSLIAIILAFILFFGVLVFKEREDELSKLSKEFCSKSLKAIKFVIPYEKQWAVNFGEMLSKNDMLEVHFGLLFTYFYEGEKIKILTKFKGEKPKVIATEKIEKVIIVGRKRVRL